MSYEVRDNWGRRVGTIRVANDSWSCCLTGIIGLGVAIALIIYGISSLITWIQSNNLPFHDPLTNIKTMYDNGPNVNQCYSSSDGYHVVDFDCEYSSIEYDDVNISVAATLVKGDIHSIYGISFRGKGHPSMLGITSDGKWFYAHLGLGAGLDSYTIPQKPGASIKQGVNATNILEVQTHGSHFVFFVNGVNVGEMDDPSALSKGAIFFSANGNVSMANDSSDVEVVFTELTVTRNAQTEARSSIGRKILDFSH